MKKFWSVLVTILLLLFLGVGCSILVGRYKFNQMVTNVEEQIEEYHDANYKYIELADIEVYKKDGNLQIVESIEANNIIVDLCKNMNNYTTIVSKTLFKETWNNYKYSIQWMCTDFERHIDLDRTFVYSIKVLDPEDYTKVYLWIDEYGVIREDITSLSK